MVQGRFDSHGQPFLPVGLTGLHGTVTLQALIDTGFDGDLCIPLTVAMTIGLELKDADYVELAGSAHPTVLPKIYQRHIRSREV